MMGSSNFTVAAWLFIMIFCAALDLGFTVYKYVRGLTRFIVLRAFPRRG